MMLATVWGGGIGEEGVKLRDWTSARRAVWNGKGYHHLPFGIFVYQDDIILIAIGRNTAAALEASLLNTPQELEIAVSDKDDPNSPFGTKFEALGVEFVLPDPNNPHCRPTPKKLESIRTAITEMVKAGNAPISRNTAQKWVGTVLLGANFVQNGAFLCNAIHISMAAKLETESDCVVFSVAQLILDEIDELHLAPLVRSSKLRFEGQLGLSCDASSGTGWASQILVRTPHEQGKVPCEVCNTVFPTYHALARHHRAVHLNERPHVCTYCDRRFGQKPTTVHLKYRNHLCPHCQRRFGTNSDLQKHFRSVLLKERPFSCDHCDKRFGSRPQVRKHISTVHLKQKPHKCLQRQKSFSLKHHLTVHLRQVHFLAPEKDFNKHVVPPEKDFENDPGNDIITNKAPTALSASALDSVADSKNSYGEGGN